LRGDVRADSRQLAPALSSTPCVHVCRKVSASASAYPASRVGWCRAIADTSSTNANAPRLIGIILSIRFCPCCCAPATKQKLIRRNRQARWSGSWARTAAEVSRGFHQRAVMPVTGARNRHHALDQSLLVGTVAGTRGRALAYGCSIWNVAGFRSRSLGRIAPKRRLRRKPSRGTPRIRQSEL
jgi:hypothetical protein